MKTVIKIHALIAFILTGFVIYTSPVNAQMVKTKTPGCFTDKDAMFIICKDGAKFDESKEVGTRLGAKLKGQNYPSEYVLNKIRKICYQSKPNWAVQPHTPSCVDMLKLAKAINKCYDKMGCLDFETENAKLARKYN